MQQCANGDYVENHEGKEHLEILEEVNNKPLVSANCILSYFRRIEIVLENKVQRVTRAIEANDVIDGNSLASRNGAKYLRK